MAADSQLDGGVISPTFETEEEGDGRVSPLAFEVDGRVSPSIKKAQVRLVQAPDYFDAFGGGMDDSDEDDMAAERLPSVS